MPENNAYANANYQVEVLAEEYIEVVLRGRRRRGPELFVVGQVPIALVGDSEPILVQGRVYIYWLLAATAEQGQALQLIAAVRAAVASRGIEGAYPE